MADDDSTRENLAAHLVGTPAVYEKSPQDDTARNYAQSLSKIIRNGRKLDKEEAEWLNLYNRYKAKGRAREDLGESEEEYNKKDIHLFFMDKIAKLQDSYEARIAKIQAECETRIAAKEKRIDDILAQSEKSRDANLTEILKIVNTSNRDATTSIEKAHNGANGHIVNTLNASNNLSTSLANSVAAQWNNASEISKKHFGKLQELLDKEEEPGYFATFMEEVLIPLAPKIKEAAKDGLPALLQRFQTK